MDWIADKLRIDPLTTSKAIEKFLQIKLSETARRGYLLGLSGGLDSAIVAYLMVRAVGPHKVVFLNPPDRDSKTLHIQHAQTISQALGLQKGTPMPPQNIECAWWCFIIKPTYKACWWLALPTARSC
jgi:NAD+ synthase